ncbi:dihydroxyacetone kinase-like protein [Hydrogenophaga palleronii]|uniref:Dihydroxyacetone kinase-like protein n=2 Tax=Hydrogenophaga palleronii TaxID=65655 RepID=A0ABU1WMR6_9BURK|nr:dihydroxyacetone kinase-like protein [Hydrogenophaga palleronii]
MDQSSNCNCLPLRPTPMKKFQNSAHTFVHESLRGLAEVHADILAVHLDPTYVVRRENTPGQVAVISGGGSGHEPLDVGYVGQGMLAAACPGEIFTSCTPNQIVAAAQAAEQGAGCLFIVKNYRGDLLNFETALDMLDFDCSTVVVDDDASVDTSPHSVGRRGAAGTLIVQKVVGAAAAAGASLAECKTVGCRVNSQTASAGVSFQGCMDPITGSPTFVIGADEIEFGVGLHGEPGRQRIPMASAENLAARMLDTIMRDLKPKPEHRLLLCVNGFGATPLSELYVLFNAASGHLKARGLNIHCSLVGNYATSLDTPGGSITVTVLDDEIASLWLAPVHTAALRW